MDYGLVIHIVNEGLYPTTCVAGKGGDLDKNNNRVIKLLHQVMKITERVKAQLIWETVSLDDIQSGLVPGRTTTNAVFLIRQLQEKYQTKHKPQYLAFVDLEKGFERVSQSLIWQSI